MSSKVQLVTYSEKAIAIFGETKPYINSLKELGGKFNPALSHENEKSPGWIFPKKSLDKVQELVTKINAGVIKPTETSSEYREKTVDVKMFMALVSRVERLEQELKLFHSQTGMKEKSSKNEVETTSDYDEPDEESSPVPRLMKRK